MIEGFPESSLVLVNLVNPKEKFFGVLKALSPAGVTVQAINLDAFDDWIHQIARDDDPDLELITMFVPLFRVERIFLDEPAGAVKSFSQRFEDCVGKTCRSVCERIGETPDGGCAECPVERAFLSNHTEHREFHRVDETGSRHHYLTALPIRGADGRPQEVMVTIQDLGELGMLAGQPAVLLHVARRLLAGQQRVELAEAADELFELFADAGFHGQ